MTTPDREDPDTTPDTPTSGDAASPQSTATPPPMAPTIKWNTRKAAAIRKGLEDEGLTWIDPPTDEWLKDTERALKRKGNPRLAQEMKASVLRTVSPVTTALGREQQARTAKAAVSQEAKAKRGTVTNERGQNVARKLPMSTLIGGGVGALLLLGGLTYGGVAAYQSSAKDAAARRAAAQAQQAAGPTTANTIPVVTPADPNAVVANPNSGPEIVKADPISEDPSTRTGTSRRSENPDGTPKTSATDSAPPDQQGQQDAYAQGKRDGEVAGYASGQREGYAQGKQEGVQGGYQQGVKEGQQQGAQAGYQQGVKDGQAQAARTAPPQGQGAVTPISSSGAQPVAITPVSRSGAATPTRVGSGAAATPVVTPGKLTFTGGSQGAQGAQAQPPRMTFTSAPTSGDSQAAQGQGNRGVTMYSNPAAAQATTAPTAFALREAPAPTQQAVNVGGRLIMVGAPQATASTPSGADSAAAPEAQGSVTKTYGDMTIVVPSRTGNAASTSTSTPASTPAATTGSAQPSAAPAASAPTFGPYRAYQTIRARLETAVLVMEGSRVNLNVIARSSDGRKWIGTPSVAGAQRVNLTFTQLVDLDGKTVLNVPAMAYDQSGVPGVQGSGQDLAPDVVRNLIRNAATGVRDYAQAQLNASRTTISPNGQVIVEKEAPSLWTLVGGRALSVFDMPENTRTFTRATYLPSGTDIVLVVGAQPVKE